MAIQKGKQYVATISRSGAGRPTSRVFTDWDAGVGWLERNAGEGDRVSLKRWRPRRR